MHEARAINRMAGVARGRVLVLLQVGTRGVGSWGPVGCVPGCRTASRSVGIRSSASEQGLFACLADAHPQDDDTLQPADCSWAPALLKQFEAMPKLGMVGLKGYRRGATAGNKVRAGCQV